MSPPRLVVGVDLGGTSIVVGTVPEDGSALYGFDAQPTPVAAGPDAVADRIVEMIRASIDATRKELGPGIEVAGVGVGAPGPLDTARGIVIVAPNLGWKDMPLRDRVAHATGLDTTLENDANCATLGEWWRGAAQDVRFVAGITIGTGIGGGIVLDGRIYHGASDVAAEFGHTTIDITGRRCKCGNYGCLEAYASGPAIAARAVEELQAGTPSAIPRYVDNDLGRVTAATVYQAAQDGDELAQEVVRDTARFLGAGVANLVNILNPEVVVLAGGVTQAGERLFAPLRIEVKRRAFRPAVEACRIVPGALTGTAGVYGAVASHKVQRWGGV
jgi:glucokinase